MPADPRLGRAVSTPSDPDEVRYTTGRIVIEMGLTAAGGDQVWTTITGTTAEDDKPPLITVLGMLDMARTTAYELYAGDQEDE